VTDHARVAAALAAVRDDPAGALVAVDYDGTLSPLVARPEQARLAEGGLQVLRRLAGRVGTLAVVTGRAAEHVVSLGGLDAVDGLHVLGHYGLEHWYDGRLDSPRPDPGVERVRERLPDLLAGAPDGVEVEDKALSLVVHTRGTAAPTPTLEALTPDLLALADREGLEAVPGRWVLEIRPHGTDKGVVLHRLVHDVHPRTVVYAGDDLGDLPAFAAVEELRAAGLVALTVASSGEGEDAAPEELVARADLVLAGPPAVVDWLGTLV
jgi:trehalose 6-phosphate phosphatase